MSRRDARRTTPRDGIGARDGSVDCARCAPARRHARRPAGCWSPSPATPGRRRSRRRRGPGRRTRPREVNLIAKDYSFLPATLDLIPGETVLLHLINGGLEVHEAVIGDAAVQAAWEAAEAATVGAPPGPTPIVSVPPDVSGRARRRPLRRARRPALDGPGRRRSPAAPRPPGPSGATSPATSPTACRSRSDGSPNPHREGSGGTLLTASARLRRAASPRGGPA